jgi:hypothetical protein
MTKDQGQKPKGLSVNNQQSIISNSQTPTTSDQPPATGIIGEKLKKINIRSGDLMFILVG